MLAVNVKGVFLAIKHAAPIMVRQAGSVIINVASFVGTTHPIPQAAIYGASKAAVLSLTRAAAAAYADQHLRVYAVCPWMTDTPMADRPDRQRPGDQGPLRGGHQSQPATGHTRRPSPGHAGPAGRPHRATQRGSRAGGPRGRPEPHHAHDGRVAAARRRHQLPHANGAAGVGSQKSRRFWGRRAALFSPGKPALVVRIGLAHPPANRHCAQSSPRYAEP
ncbi:MAG: SDR family oxidoreductase [Hymenobacter sp.]